MSDPNDKMVLEVDSLHGYVIEKSEIGPVYRDDGSLVDFENPRPCLGCSRRIGKNEHDPCIANLPGTIHACCGHGLAHSPRSGGPNGYVAFRDGRRIVFLGTVGSEKIRAAVDAFLAGEELPEGFALSDDMWYVGLTEAQQAYVHQHLRQAIFDLVREVTDGQFPPDEYLTTEIMWNIGVPQEKVQIVWGRFGQLMAELAEQALQNA